MLHSSGPRPSVGASIFSNIDQGPHLTAAEAVAAADPLWAAALLRNSAVSAEGAIRAAEAHPEEQLLCRLASDTRSSKLREAAVAAAGPEMTAVWACALWHHPRDIPSILESALSKGGELREAVADVAAESALHHRISLSLSQVRTILASTSGRAGVQLAAEYALLLPEAELTEAVEKRHSSMTFLQHDGDVELLVYRRPDVLEVLEERREGYGEQERTLLEAQVVGQPRPLTAERLREAFAWTRKAQGQHSLFMLRAMLASPQVGGREHSKLHLETWDRCVAQWRQASLSVPHRSTTHYQRSTISPGATNASRAHDIELWISLTSGYRPAVREALSENPKVPRATRVRMRQKQPFNWCTPEPAAVDVALESVGLRRERRVKNLRTSVRLAQEQNPDKVTLAQILGRAKGYQHGSPRNRAACTALAQLLAESYGEDRAMWKAAFLLADKLPNKTTATELVELASTL